MNLFKTMGGNLPLITVIFIAIVNFFSNYILHIVIVVAVLVLVAFLYIRTPAGAYQKDMLLLRMPLLGRLNLLNCEARVCRSISMLFKSGLPLPEILTLGAESSGNRVMSKALMTVEQDIIKGDALAISMARNPVFMPLMVEMTRVGEETGNLDNTLTLVADSFEIEAADKLQTALALIEPAMTIGIGLVVGFLALSIFVPIYSSLSLIK
jgi:type IV pilus assembly protein PilC